MIGGMSIAIIFAVVVVVITAAKRVFLMINFDLLILIAHSVPHFPFTVLRRECYEAFTSMNS